LTLSQDPGSFNALLSQPVSRREFLNLSALSFGSLFFNNITKLEVNEKLHYGRVAEIKCDVFDRPSLKEEIIGNYWKDTVLKIDEVTVGDVEPPHNRIWYKIENVGYVHSGSIQPVQTKLNLPPNEFPSGGTLVEVTVPYTDAHWGPGKNYPFAYRFYFESTYWATDLITDTSGLKWFRIRDDKWKVNYYVPTQHLRLVPAEELSPISGHTPIDAKRLEVRLSDQVVIAFEWERPVFMARIASGAIFSNGRYLTPKGTHKTFHKRPSRHMAAGDLASNGYDLPGVPWICYINEQGVAFHGTYWHNDYGRPRSHGCINMTPLAAKWIYRWTQPSVPYNQQDVYEKFGTRVDVVE
jgi:hypothetical protein